MKSKTTTRPQRRSAVYIQLYLPSGEYHEKYEWMNEWIKLNIYGWPPLRAGSSFTFHGIRPSLCFVKLVSPWLKNIGIENFRPKISRYRHRYLTRCHAVAVSFDTTALCMRLLWHSMSFLYRPTSSTVQMLKLHHTVRWFSQPWRKITPIAENHGSGTRPTSRGKPTVIVNTWLSYSAKKCNNAYVH